MIPSTSHTPLADSHSKRRTKWEVTARVAPWSSSLRVKSNKPCPKLTPLGSRQANYLLENALPTSLFPSSSKLSTLSWLTSKTSSKTPWTFKTISSFSSLFQDAQKLSRRAPPLMVQTRGRWSSCCVTATSPRLFAIAYYMTSGKHTRAETITLVGVQLVINLQPQLVPCLLLWVLTLKGKEKEVEGVLRERRVSVQKPPMRLVDVAIKGAVSCMSFSNVLFFPCSLLVLPTCRNGGVALLASYQRVSSLLVCWRRVSSLPPNSPSFLLLLLFLVCSSLSSLVVSLASFLPSPPLPTLLTVLGLGCGAGWGCRWLRVPLPPSSFPSHLFTLSAFLSSAYPGDSVCTVTCFTFLCTLGVHGKNFSCLLFPSQEITKARHLAPTAFHHVSLWAGQSRTSTSSKDSVGGCCVFLVFIYSLLRRVQVAGGNLLFALPLPVWILLLSFCFGGFACSYFTPA